jgi:cytochrome c-type biogenesis protein CcsB
MGVLSFSDFGIAASPIGKIPIQSGGRAKPFDTFARESLQLVYGKSKYKDRDAAEVVFTWTLLAQHWNDTEMFEISRKDLKDNLKLDPARKHFSIKEILDNPRLSLLMQELESQIADKKKLDPYFQGVQRLESQLQTFQAIVGGYALTFLPVPGEANWKSVRDFDQVWQGRYQKLVGAFAESLKEGGNQKLLIDEVDSFITAARAELPPASTIRPTSVHSPNRYPSDLLIEAELHYNNFAPFRWSWIFYLLASLMMIGAVFFKWSGLWTPGWAFTVIAFISHTWGFGLRIYITERPPVSNMYETVIWVAWGAVLLSMIFEIWKPRKIFILSANIVSVLCMITADVAPNVLDPALQPLQPVLRSNLWLIVHVMTITLGYSAFFLAFVLANFGLWHFVKSETERKAQIFNMTEATYRALQIGVVLLAAGTILGGVWADYSWGRFWGWDPKETWAFIALMGYIAVLHGRISGWIRQFGFLVFSAVCFSLVIMAWYGVNFVLGAGLHSYGFGGGGIEYVSGFIALEFVYLAYVITVRQSRIKKQIN